MQLKELIIFCWELKKISKNEICDILTDDCRKSYPANLKEAVKVFEAEHIREIYKRNNFNKEKTANELGIGLSSLYRKLIELGLERWKLEHHKSIYWHDNKISQADREKANGHKAACI